MSPQIVLASVILLIGFVSGWTVQDWRFSSKEADRAQQELATVKQSAAADVRRLDNTIDAQSKATIRERALRGDADALRGAVVGLSDAENRALRTARDSQDTCLVAATTFRELFDASTEEYRALAEKADRHASDIQTLIDAYPK